MLWKDISVRSEFVRYVGFSAVKFRNVQLFPLFRFESAVINVLFWYAVAWFNFWLMSVSAKDLSICLISSECFLWWVTGWLTAVSGPKKVDSHFQRTSVASYLLSSSKFWLLPLFSRAYVCLFDRRIQGSFVYFHIFVQNACFGVRYVFLGVSLSLGFLNFHVLLPHDILTSLGDVCKGHRPVPVLNRFPKKLF